jgi:glucosamine 6-phosphate synthetase-like amidotransferase/phosphosugar isomerase protein
MCGITGVITNAKVTASYFYRKLLNTSEIRGQDGTGVSFLKDNVIETFKFDKKASLLSDLDLFCLNHRDFPPAVIGQNRLSIFGLSSKNNQPLTTNRFSLVHNGSLFDFEGEFERLSLKREYEVDTELLLRKIEKYVNDHEDLPLFIQSSKEAVQKAVQYTMASTKGNFACLLLDSKTKTLTAFSKYKPLFYCRDLSENIYFFSTERIGRKVFSLEEIKILQIPNKSIKMFCLH